MREEKKDGGNAERKSGMVSSAHGLASRAGAEILAAGGNAADAAVATAAALSVVEPNASGPGGGGFMTILTERGAVVLDFREIAPASTRGDLFASEEARREKRSSQGGRAICVPGWLAGMCRALEDFGSMTFAQVVAPAIRIAEEGFRIHPMQHRIIREESAKLGKFNDPDRVPFFREGIPLAAGELCRQPDLARTFRRIASEGPDLFYGGELGRDLVEAANRSGGAMDLEDLRAYRVAVREPVSGTYRGYGILSAPPASSGGAHLVELLNLLEALPGTTGTERTDPARLHLLAEAMKRVFADREAYMADSAFARVPLAGLVHKGYARIRAEGIRSDRAAAEVAPGDPRRWDEDGGDPGTLPSDGGTPAGHGSTTSFSVADGGGNLVACTCTVNDFFGSGVLVPNWGIVLNDEMDDFSPDPRSVNAPEPGKRPLSSMSPTLVLDPGGRPYAALGAAGATRIITALAQVLTNLIDYGMTVEDALRVPRIHAQVSRGVPEGLILEEGTDEGTKEALRALGHELDLRPREDFVFGAVQAIRLRPEGPDGGADPRRLGATAKPD